MFWTHWSLLVEYIKVHKKIDEHLLGEKDIWYKKPLVHMFFFNALNI
jgi:hypothetical protein